MFLFKTPNRSLSKNFCQIFIPVNLGEKAFNKDLFDVLKENIFYKTALVSGGRKANFFGHWVFTYFRAATVSGRGGGVN